jgi:2-dehydropantoate 2-reductase
VRHCGEGETLVAAEEHNAAQVVEVAALLSRAGIKVAVVDDLSFILWRKVLFNSAINPVTALLGIKNGRLARIPGAWDVAVSCFREAREVAAAAVGPEIGQVTEDDLRDLCAKTEENVSSMLQDVRSGKRTEIHAINGVVIEEASRYGKDVPANRAIVQLITALEEARR